jgi:hypothetical protein
MRILLLSIIAIVSMTGYGLSPDISAKNAVDSVQAKFLDKTEFAFLSDGARESLKTIFQLKREFKEKLHEMCGIKSAITPEIKEKLKAIREDDSLDRAAKRAAKKELFAPIKDALEQNREARKECKERMKDQLAPLMAKKKAIKEACFLAHEESKSDDGKGKAGRLFKMVRSLTDEQKTELNAKLTSSECSAAVAAANE